MQILCSCAPALAVAGLFYLWRDGVVKPAKHRKILRERVTFMLWCAFNEAA
jgi:hypothetical protein